MTWLFQSTPPARGATWARHVDSPNQNFNPRPPRGGRHWLVVKILASQLDFNPRPPRGGRRRGTGKTFGALRISIHAPREGGDVGCETNNDFDLLFQSTPPARGATELTVMYNDGRLISIHAPREGGDRPSGAAGAAVASISIHAPREGGDAGPRPKFRPPCDFNPRPPRGGRRSYSCIWRS